MIAPNFPATLILRNLPRARKSKVQIVCKWKGNPTSLQCTPLMKSGCIHELSIISSFPLLYFGIKFIFFWSLCFVESSGYGPNMQARV